jgi:YtcA-like protein
MMPRARVSSRPRSGDAVSLCLALVVVSGLTGCDGSPSRNILGSYFPSWMVCAIAGIAIAGVARMIFKSTGLLQELPVPFVVLLAIGCASTFTLWLLWLA